MTHYDAKTHAAGVARIARRISKTLALKREMIEHITYAAYLHDIGKERIPIEIVNKQGELTEEEFAVMKEHPRLGFEILNNGSLMKIAALGALEHHERFDGSGYMGIAGESISLVGRIIAVADVFDALNTHRPYRKAWTIGQVSDYFTQQRGKDFDPEVVDALLYGMV